MELLEERYSIVVELTEEEQKMTKEELLRKWFSMTEEDYQKAKEELHKMHI